MNQIHNARVVYDSVAIERADVTLLNHEDDPAWTFEVAGLVPYETPPTGAPANAGDYLRAMQEGALQKLFEQHNRPCQFAGHPLFEDRAITGTHVHQYAHKRGEKGWHVTLKLEVTTAAV